MEENKQSKGGKKCFGVIKSPAGVLYFVLLYLQTNVTGTNR